MNVPQLELFRDDYRLRERVSAKARQVRIEVHPDKGAGAEVVLAYPRWMPRSEALNFLRSREGWVRDKLKELAERAEARPVPPPARWDGSDRIPLRGVLLPVQPVPATLKKMQVRLEAASIQMFASPAVLGEQKLLARALTVEFKHQAQRDAQRYLEEEAPRLDVKYSALKIHDPKTLWGSCNPGGVICLSWRLVMAPPEVFRYVVVHELCHLRHANHSARYWALVDRQMPGYEAHKQWLREHGHELHHYLRA